MSSRQPMSNSYMSFVTKNVPGRVGKPRLDPYNRLLSRFYEPLILLEVLGSFRGDHTQKRRDSSPQAVRRQFTDDLAFVCEYDKGGNSCTAIGIETTDQDFVYWTASNDHASEKIVNFLASLLAELKAIVQTSSSQSRREDHERNLISQCLSYAKAKITKQKDILFKRIEACISRLERPGITTYAGLVDWLQLFTRTNDNITLCKLAFQSRKSIHMKQLEKFAQGPTYHADPGDLPEPFSQVRHYIGRLADHIRVPKRLIDNLNQCDKLFANPFKVQPVPLFKSVPRPEADSHTTLEAICTRMLPAKDPRLEETRNQLADLDRTAGIHERMLIQYEKSTFKPRVHAEVQVLEHFYRGRLKWADGDRYVGCTKPACYCCQQYFRHHPAKPVEPESHLRIWLNWGPPLLRDGAKDKMYKQQRDILNLMVDNIRKEALEQIQQNRQPHPWHPDSRTAITSSSSGIGSNQAKDDIAHIFEDVGLDDLSTQDNDDSSGAENSTSETSASTSSIITLRPEPVQDALVDSEADEDDEGGALL